MGLTGRDQRVLIHSFAAPYPANVSLYQAITASLRHRQMENKWDGDGVYINYMSETIISVSSVVKVVAQLES